MNSVLVSDVMAKHPPAIHLGTDLIDVVETLLSHHLTGLPVVDGDGHVVGFVSEQDCLRTLLVSSYHGEGSHKVDSVMHAEPLTIAHDTSLVDVAEQMIKQKPKIYPVVDANRRLVGLLIRSQVLRALKDSRRNNDN